MRKFSRRQRKIKRALRKINISTVLKVILYSLGVYAFIYSEREYSTTLVSFQTIITIGIITGVVAALIIERHYKYYLFSIILVGSIGTAIFLKFNKSFAESHEVKLKLRILDKTLKSPKIERTSVTVEYEDFSRDVDVDRDQEYLMGPSAFVVLTARKGGLGYYVITYRELVNK